MKILKFSSEYCGPCKAVSRLLQEYKFDIDELDVHDSELTQVYNIKAVPTLVILQDGVEVKRLVGGQITKKELDSL